jgi:hypothetical protein
VNVGVLRLSWWASRNVLLTTATGVSSFLLRDRSSFGVRDGTTGVASFRPGRLLLRLGIGERDLNRRYGRARPSELSRR